jgi:hypothetical protein
MPSQRLSRLIRRAEKGDAGAHAELLEAFRAMPITYGSAPITVDAARERINALLADIKSTTPDLPLQSVAIILMLNLSLVPARIARILDADLAAVRGASKTYADARIYKNRR